MQVIVGNNMQGKTVTILYKNTNPEVCVSRDNGVLRCKDRKKN